MKALIYSIIIATFSFVDDLGKDFWGTVFGGAVEELLESIVEAFFPTAKLPFRGHKKTKKAMHREIADVIDKLSPEEKSELAAFARKFVKKWKNDEAFKDYVIDLSDKNEKRIRQDLKKAFNTELKKLKKEQLKTVELLSVEGILADVFGENETPPESVSRIVKIINKTVFELKYVAMSAEDRDVIKVIQYMNQESNDRLAEDLKAYFNLIFKQNNDPAVLTALRQNGDGNMRRALDSVAKRDPFFYVPLKCPNCGNAGDGIIRTGDRLFCASCGQRTDIVQNIVDDEIPEKIAEIKVMLEEKLSELNVSGDVKKIQSSIDLMASKIASSEYIEAKLEEVKQQSFDSQRYVSGLIENALADIKADIKRETANKKACLSDEIFEAATKNVIERMDALNEGILCFLKEIDETTKKIDERTEKIYEGNNEIYKFLVDFASSTELNGKEKEKLLSSLQSKVDFLYTNTDLNFVSLSNKLQKILEALRVEPAPSIAPSIEATCPRCQRSGEEQFKKLPVVGKSGEYYYSCSCCGYRSESTALIEQGDLSLGWNKLRISENSGESELSLVFDGDIISKDKRNFVLKITSVNSENITLRPSFSLRKAEVKIETVLLLKKGHVSEKQLTERWIPALDALGVKKIILGSGLSMPSEIPAHWKKNGGFSLTKIK